MVFLAMASAKFAREVSNLFGDHHVFFLSQDDKAPVPLGLSISKKQTAILMPLKYSCATVTWLSNQNQAQAYSIYAVRLKKDGEVSYNGPTFISVTSGKHDRSCASANSEDFESVLELEEFQDAATTPNRELKPFVFISVDGGPDQASKNQKVLTVWARQF